MTENPWGRVDEHGTVSVREGDDWREVGQYPDATPEEALAYFERKFADLEGQVRLLEQRIRGGASATDVAKAASHLTEAVSGANAVGDLAALHARLEALGGKIGALTEQQQAESKAAVDQAIAERTAIVEQMEALAAKDQSSIQWNQVQHQVEALFTQWKAHQKDAPRIPKGVGDALWKRFREARGTIDAGKRAFFAGLDAQHRDAKSKKQQLVEQARALAPKGADGIPAYRSLLDEWKLAGRAGRKVDDALWAEFKEAGDVLFQAKAEIAAVEHEEYAENLAKKEALLAEAAPILATTDRQRAKDALLGIQRKWDEIGRVPREALRRVEDGMRAVESHVRKLEDDHWKQSNPERKARSEGLAGQLEDAIAKLEDDLAAAKSGGDATAAKTLENELATKRQWLEVVAAAR